MEPNATNDTAGGDTMPKDAPWWARWMVAEWRDCWRWLSTYLIGAAALAPVAYEQIGALKDAMPPQVFHWIETGLVALIFFQNVRKKTNGGAA